MRKDLRILMLILATPLLLFGSGYTYATQTIGTYIVENTVIFTQSDREATATVSCNEGDTLTGGGYDGYGVEMGASDWVPLRNKPASPDSDTWMVTIRNFGALDLPFTVYAVCMPLITVAGIGVPEFGYMYIPMILGAVVYALVTRMGKLRLVSAK